MNSHTVSSHSLVGVVWSADLVGAARLMIEKNIGALGVYSNKEHDLLGIITERDITRAVAEGMDLAQTRVSQVMSDSPLTAEGPITREQAEALMHKGHVRHLIVKQDGSDRVVSIRDI